MTPNPYADNPFVLRAERAKKMIINAGLTMFMREITKAANEAAGADHAKYFEVIREQIGKRLDDKTEKKRLQDKDKFLQPPASAPVDSNPKFHPLLIGRTFTPEQVRELANMVIDIKEMLDEGHTEFECLLYLRRTYGIKI